MSLLFIPHTNLHGFGDRAFSLAASTLWNSLPTQRHNTPSLGIFKKLLKNYLLKKAFNSIFS